MTTDQVNNWDGNLIIILIYFNVIILNSGILILHKDARKLLRRWRDENIRKSIHTSKLKCFRST